MGSPCYIFVTGGVVSSLGKGIVSASLGLLLKSRGYSISIRKLDPYINVDPGTMNPKEHGEVYVTDDGAETDLDLGHYERFTGIETSQEDNITSGYIYKDVIEAERRGDYLGKTLQVIPHITERVKKFILSPKYADKDFVIVEIGGTVGDIESLPFLESIRQISRELPKKNTIFIHLTLLPYLKTSGELKTKPTQHSVRELMRVGVIPDVLICRSENKLDSKTIKKISELCSVWEEDVISAPDLDNVNSLPIELSKSGLDARILSHSSKKAPNNKNLVKEGAQYFESWKKCIQRTKKLSNSLSIGIVAKYLDNNDTYKSLMEALSHSGLKNNVNIKINWIDGEILEKPKHPNYNKVRKLLKSSDGIIVPGGFGSRGINGKLIATRYARENNIPYFGICLGMQVALIEYARNKLNIKDANSREFSNSANGDIIIHMSQWEKDNGDIISANRKNLGGTMRLGSYTAKLSKNSFVKKIYGGANTINERHRHRYEFNNKYKEKFLSDPQVCFSFSQSNKELVEIFELDRKVHPWFVCVQYHPEFKSNMLNPHPLFLSFIKEIKSG